MASSVVPDRFEGGDFDQWLRHFDRCAVANGWANAAQLIQLPAFLKGPAATFYESLAEESKGTGPKFAAVAERLNPAGQNDGHSQLMDNRTVQNSMCKSLSLNFQGVP